MDMYYMFGQGLIDGLIDWIDFNFNLLTSKNYHQLIN